MTWLRHNLGSIGMALLLSLLTWAWLYSESTATPRPLVFDFRPRTSPEMAEKLATLRYDVNDADLPANRIQIEVTGPRGIVETLRPLAPCEPFLDDALFRDQLAGQFDLPLERDLFRLPPSVQIKAIPKVKVHFVCYTETAVTVVTSPADAEGVPEGFRISEIQPIPEKVRVRRPVDHPLATDTTFPIQKIHIAGRTSTFETPGTLKLPSTIRQIDTLRLVVVLERAAQTVIVKEVKLNLAGPPHILRRLQFKNERTIEVKVEGPEEYVKGISAQDLYAFVQCNHLTPRDFEISPILLKEDLLGCLIVSPKLQPHIRVKEIMGDQPVGNRTTEVIVLPEK